MPGTNYDVAVLGAGLVGAACADALAGEGHRVVVLESGRAMREASWAGVGLLTPLQPWRYPRPLLDLGQMAVEEHKRLAVELLRETGIDVELEQTGLVFVGGDLDRLEEAYREAGARRVDLRPLAPGLSRDVREGIELPESCHVRNHRLGRALLARAQARGAELRESAPVLEIRPGQGVRTPDGLVPARIVVVCAGAWARRLCPELSVDPVRGHVLLFKGSAARILIFAGGQYAIPRRGGLLLFGGTLEEGVADPRPSAVEYRRLLERAAQVLGLDEADCLAAWAGIRPGSPGGIPRIGWIPGREGVLAACGHHRNGILLAPPTGRLVARLVAGETLPNELRFLAPGEDISV